MINGLSIGAVAAFVVFTHTRPCIKLLTEKLAIALLNGFRIQISDDGEIIKIELDSVQTESKLTL